MMTATRSEPNISPRPPGQVRHIPEATSTGKVPFMISSTGDKAETAYWLWGDLTMNSRVPLICLHGGPGVPHNYLLPLAHLHSDYGIPVLMYDQVGCGGSTHFRERNDDEKFWTPELFMRELDNLKSHLGIKQFDLLGQSWGGMLAGQYAITQPPGLRKLLILDSPASMITWAKVTAKQRAALPAHVREVLDRCEREGQTETEEYEEAVMYFYKIHLCRLDPFPDELLHSFDQLKEDHTVYNTMNGPSEFTILGSLKNWSIEDGLRQITERTVPGGMLVVNGYWDEAQDDCCLPFFRDVKCKVKWVQFAMSGHCPQLEETERCIEQLGAFLTS
ncbi:proline-specific peptidase [Polychaeton citri CBS 116435]|uniref:Proline-specific peptidase n=1 Tax=Polychaeton citri CBS 116435 TaxID=1314669 RepID=A0A9P4UJX0_9PEZI|nr:proline-specific peptidase [Polychaeton citri CBS 116435]